MDLAVKAFVSKGLPYLPDSNADRIRVVCAHLPGGFDPKAFEQMLASAHDTLTVMNRCDTAVCVRGVCRD